MSIFLIENTIYSDGIGDYSHFVDIISFLKRSPFFRGVEIIPIVHFERARQLTDEERDYGLLEESGSKENYERIRLNMIKLMKQLGIKYYWYGNTSECRRFFSNKVLFDKGAIQENFTNQDELSKFFSEQNPNFLYAGNHHSESKAVQKLIVEESEEQETQFLEMLQNRIKTPKVTNKCTSSSKLSSNSALQGITIQKITRKKLLSYFSNKGEVNAFWIKRKLCLSNIGTFSEAFLENYEKMLGSAAQLILTSFNTQLVVMQKSHIEFYGHLLKKEIVKKTIFEHERQLNPNVQGFAEYNMGLGDNCYGIKIKPEISLSKNEAYNVLTGDAAFCKAMKGCSELERGVSFSDAHTLLPAYFNELSGLMGFINLLVSNQSFSQDKKIVVHLSGFKDSEALKRKLGELYQYYLVKGVDVKYYQQDAEVQCLPLKEHNKENTRKIVIIDGIYLSNDAYQALYQQADIAGVSGDNTFEQCISTNTLPFYRSTNYDDKLATVRALRIICTSNVKDLSEEAKEAFASYFDDFYMASHVLDFEKYLFYSNTMPQEEKEEMESMLVFEHLNFQVMIAEWGKVTDYLREHKNLYNSLIDIVKKDIFLDKKKQPSQRQAMLAMTGAYGQGHFVPKIRRKLLQSSEKSPVAEQRFNS